MEGWRKRLLGCHYFRGFPGQYLLCSLTHGDGGPGIASVHFTEGEGGPRRGSFPRLTDSVPLPLLSAVSVFFVIVWSCFVFLMLLQEQQPKSLLGLYSCSTASLVLRRQIPWACTPS